jgi:hypothetical protein
VFKITSAGESPSQFAGEWKADVQLPAQSGIFELKADGTMLTGIVRPGSTGAQPIAILDDKIDGDTITFKFKSPDGRRTITSIGTLNGDEIAFRRGVEGPSPDGPGRGLFGAAALPTFTAKRTTKR